MSKVPFEEEAVKSYLDNMIAYWTRVEEIHSDLETINNARAHVGAFVNMKNALFNDDIQKLYENQAEDQLEKATKDLLRSSFKNSMKFPRVLMLGLVPIDTEAWLNFVINYSIKKEPHLRKQFIIEDNKRFMTQTELQNIMEVVYSIVGTPDEIKKEIEEEKHHGTE